MTDDSILSMINLRISMYYTAGKMRICSTHDREILAAKEVAMAELYDAITKQIDLELIEQEKGRV